MAGDALNQNDPSIVGPEVSLARHNVRTVALDGDSVGVRQKVTARAAAQIDSGVDAGAVYLQGFTDSDRWHVDVYDAADVEATDYETVLFLPSADDTKTNVEGITGAGASDTTDIYEYVDDPNPRSPVSPNDYIVTTTGLGGGQNASAYICDVTIEAGGSVAGKRILAVRIVAVGAHAIIENGAYLDVARNQLFIEESGTEYLAPYNPQFPKGGLANTGLVVATWPNNPVTNMPWTTTDLGAFNAGAYQIGCRWGFDLPALQRTVGGYLVSFALEVVAVTEKRLFSFGGAAAKDDSPAWFISDDCEVPSGSGSHSISDGDELVFIVRRFRKDSGLDSLNFLTQRMQMQLPQATWDCDDAAEGSVEALGPFGEPVGSRVVHNQIAPVLLRDGGTWGAAGLWPYPKMQVGQCYNGVTQRQEITPGSTTTYDFIRFFAYPGSATASDTFDLTATVNGATATLTRADFDELPKLSEVSPGIEMKEVTLAFDSPVSLTGSTQYDVDFTCPAAGADEASKGWVILGLQAGSGVSAELADVATFGGTTDSGESPAGTNDDGLDWLVTVFDAPAAPSTVTAELVTTTNPDDGTAGWLEDFAYASLTWADPGQGSYTLLHYEVQRREGAGDWVTIAKLTDQGATINFNDYEPLRGVNLQYRVRQVMTDLPVVSDWTVSNGVVLPDELDNDRCYVWFSSNEDSGLNVALQATRPLQFSFLDADQVQLVPIYNRDYPLGFRATEKVGVQWELSLIVHGRDSNRGAQTVDTGDDANASGGAAAFNRLRALAEDTSIPHVTAVDSYGNRVIGVLQVTSGTVDNPGALYLAAATMRPTQAEPTPYEGIGFGN